ncbi:MAG: RiPP maturation radical SAM C-methyltransferase [Deltaproteobacteria bacterium]|nr:RiPP maturation radical SAM C-methyltransferase [Deltaproteobacteria bacterium]
MAPTRLSILEQPSTGCTTPGTSPYGPVSGASKDLRIGLVNMPFSSSRRPSIQLGLLQALLEQRDIEVTSHYLNLEFAARVGWDVHDLLCVATCAHLVGEWLFSGQAFDELPPTAEYIEQFRQPLERLCATMNQDLDFLARLRDEVVPAFIDECLERFDWGAYDVVGFTSVFQQHCAALAMARRIKERHPALTIVFGGCNLEGEMGLEFVRSVPFIDYAVIGEGDEAFPALLDRLAEGERSPTIPNVAYCHDGEVVFGGSGPRVSLEASPAPNYDDFFTTALDLELPARVRGQDMLLPFESARGCWWGAKHHCTFCSMNKAQMDYYAKPARETLAQLDELVDRYGIYTLGATDNILAPHYVDELFEVVAEQRKDYRLVYEVKANLTQAQLRSLSRGGVVWMQPGIESLNTHVLALMDKGATGLINVRMMKWARYYGISIGWHVLRGFPGERVEDYEDQLVTMRLIGHLEPPSTTSFPIRVEKFSPNYTRSKEMGFENLRPGAPYRFLYPPSVAAEEVALFFDCESHDTVSPSVLDPTDAYIREWIERWHSDDRPYLVYRRGPDRLLIIDGRGRGKPRQHQVEGVDAAVYEACNVTYRNVSSTTKAVEQALGQPVESARIQAAFDLFTAAGLMMHERGKYLSLALPTNPNW